MPKPVVPKAKAPLPRTPSPYPQRLAKQKNDNQFKNFIDMMKSLFINVPLVEALEQMPGYAKFMKDLVTKKRSMDCETIKITHQVSVIMHSMAPKLDDPGDFTIPCTIGSAEFEKALCDLGASINLMPYSVFKTLGIGQPRPSSMRLQMADRSMNKPLGIIDHVLVRVDKFILPADFVILDCEVDATLAVLQKRKKAIGWTLADIREISLAFCMHKIILEDDAKPSLEHQRRLNESMQEVVKKEVIKWLDVGVVYHISDSLWTSSGQCVPLKGGMTMVTNSQNELIPTRTVTCWRCMMAIFTDMVEDILEVFMDDFSIVGDSFYEFLKNLNRVLVRCEETNLVLNWEKCHFMVEEGIVLRHKISKYGIKVDKAKIDVISRLPPPTSVKGVRSFLGKKLKQDSLDFYWDEPYLFKICTDGVIQRIGFVFGLTGCEMLQDCVGAV
ncbi:uncharacterized protein [Nicotiana sylvestris]|uniref:uncharacterized protein n=1 Tax=Nicotiana sylvestris TaxID=4096 RepID=UPI00388C6B2E